MYIIDNRGSFLSNVIEFPSFNTICNLWMHDALYELLESLLNDHIRFLALDHSDLSVDCRFLLRGKMGSDVSVAKMDFNGSVAKIVFVFAIFFYNISLARQIP